MCDKCLCKPVCSIFRATGGNVKACEHRVEEKQCATCEWYRGSNLRFCDHPTDGMNYPAADDYCSYYAPREDDDADMGGT